MEREPLAKQGTLVGRMIGAARLDVATYEEVEADTSLTVQAAIVVLIAAVARGIGGAEAGAGAILGGLVGALVAWGVWAGVTYLIGDKVLGGTATWGELLRTLGYAQAPGVLMILGIIRPLSGIIEAIVGIWLLIAGIVAIRQALDFGTGKAILTAFLGWLAGLIVMVLLGISLGGLSGITG
jgi:hypothetical protein